MFGTRKQLRRYLDVIRPWAMGVDSRGWHQSDFQTRIPNPSNLDEPEWQDREDVKAYRLDPSHVIFPLHPYEVTLLDRLFLGSERLRAVLNLNQALSNFNAALDSVDRATDNETRWGRTILLHVGTIGSGGTGGLHDAWNIAWRVS